MLPEVNKRGMAALGMKSLGGNGQPIIQGVVTVEEALRYAMSLPVATTISGIDSLAVLRQNLAIARGFQPMTAEEMEALRSRCAPAAGDGHLELYKSTMKYDGDVGRGAARLAVAQGAAAVTHSPSRRSTMSELSGFRVAVLATDGFEETELTEPVKALREAGARVTILSPKPGADPGRPPRHRQDREGQGRSHGQGRQRRGV